MYFRQLKFEMAARHLGGKLRKLGLSSRAGSLVRNNTLNILPSSITGDKGGEGIIFEA